MIPRILAIAGSDSGGGAGIQADIKTITMLGGHAMTAITAITAQNTLGVQAVFALTPEIVQQQIRSVACDIGLDAIKIGMLGTDAIALAVRDVMVTLDVPIVVDPVMFATSGDALNECDTTAALTELFGVATLVTPNTLELAALSGLPVEDEATMREAAQRLSTAYGCVVLAKGGHLAGSDVIDLLVDTSGLIGRWSDRRIDTRHSHGTGCTLSSAIATGLGAGLSVTDAIGRARGFVRAAMMAAPELGAGHGPMGHGLGRTHFPG